MSHPKKEKARGFVVELRERSLREGIRRLPTAAALARLAGVSRLTMLRALQGLRDEGLLTLRQRQGVGIRDGSAAGQQAGDVPRSYRHVRILHALRRDILNGAWGHGEGMPTSKELSSFYGVNCRTLRKATAALVEEGLLRPHGRGLRTAGLPSGRQGAAVVLIARGDKDGNLILVATRWNENLQWLERICSRRGLRLVIDPVRLAPGQTMTHRHVRRMPVISVGADEVLGYLCWPMALTSLELAEVNARLVRSGRPAAVLEEAGGELRLRGVNVRTFGHASEQRAGAAVGRHLLSLGHRRIAYLSPVHGAPWSKQRLEGLRQVYAQAGSDTAVHACIDSRFSRLHTPVSLDRRGYDWLTRELAALHERVPEGLDLARRVVRRHIEGVDSDMEQQVLTQLMAPLIARAVGQRGATAWVAANDECAIECMDFLLSAGFAVPRDISVIGFDDTFDAQTRGLTSYNFNSPAALQAMLEHVLRPQAPGPQAGTVPILRVDGYITVRASTGPPSRPGSTH